MSGLDSFVKGISSVADSIENVSENVKDFKLPVLTTQVEPSKNVSIVLIIALIVGALFAAKKFKLI